MVCDMANSGAVGRMEDASQSAGAMGRTLVLVLDATEVKKLCEISQ